MPRVPPVTSAVRPAREKSVASASNGLYTWYIYVLYISRRFLTGMCKKRPGEWMDGWIDGMIH